MSNNGQPNYKRISPPPGKPRSEYTYVERRAELYDMIDRQGGYRNLDHSQRELGERYDVTHRTIQKDIKRILEWEKEHIGETAEAELSIVQQRAVQDFISAAHEYRTQDEPDFEAAAQCMAQAHQIASRHYTDLQQMGVKDKAPEKAEINGEVDHQHAHAHAHEHGEVGELTDRQRKHLDALTSGPEEIAVEAVEDGSDSGDDS